MALDIEPAFKALVVPVPELSESGRPVLHAVVADDTALIREGLKTPLKSLGRTLILQEADSWLQLVSLCQRTEQIDLVVVDEYLMPFWSADDLLALRAHQPNLNVVVVSNHECSTSLRIVLAHGTNGYLSKRVSSRLLTSALQLVLDGGTYVSPEAVFMADPYDASREHSTVSASQSELLSELGRRLTPRQMQVLEQLMKGKSNKLICRELDMALGTVKSHLAAIYTVLHVRSRTAAIAMVAKLD